MDCHTTSCYRLKSMWLIVPKTHCFGSVRLGLLCSATKGIWQPNPCFRSCSWEHTSLEHAQLPRQKPRSSSCLFIFLSLEFLKCKPNLSESGFGESRKSTLPSGGDMQCKTPPWKNPVVGGSSRIEAPRRNFKVHLAWSPRWETLPEFTCLARRLDKPRINWATGNVERMMFDTGRD